VNGFIDHLYKRLGATSAYNAIADLHNLLITSAHDSVFTSRFLVTGLNNEDSSASVVTPFPAGKHITTELIPLKYSAIFSQPPLQNSTELIKSQSQSENYFTIGDLLAISSIGVKPLETHDQRLSFN
jgi:hypothetical protein